MLFTFWKPEDFCFNLWGPWLIFHWSDCRIPGPAIYMCRCTLKNEVYNNSCYSYSMRCKWLGQVFCSLAFSLALVPIISIPCELAHRNFMSLMHFVLKLTMDKYFATLQPKFKIHAQVLNSQRRLLKLIWLG